MRNVAEALFGPNVQRREAVREGNGSDSASNRPLRAAEVQFSFPKQQRSSV